MRQEKIIDLMLIGRAQKLRIAKLRLTHDTNHLKVNMESANDAHHTAITEVATYILSAGCAAYGMIREKLLEKSTIDPLDYLEFGAEFMCYILHLFDRNLSGVTDGDTRSLLIDDLCVATCREHYKLLEKGGYEASQEQFHLIGFWLSILREKPPDGRGCLQAKKAQGFSPVPIHLRVFRLLKSSRHAIVGGIVEFSVAECGGTSKQIPIT